LPAWAGQLLADLGADVVKVESLAGDDTRAWGPPFIDNSDGSRDRRLFPFDQSRQAIDRRRFRQAQTAREVVRRLAACRSDVLIENLRVRGLRKYRLDYQALQAVNHAPRLLLGDRSRADRTLLPSCPATISSSRRWAGSWT